MRSLKTLSRSLVLVSVALLFCQVGFGQRIFWSLTGTGEIRHSSNLNLTGSTSFLTGLSGPGEIEVDQKLGYLLVGISYGEDIYRYNLADGTNPTVIVSSGVMAGYTDIEVNYDDGVIYGCDMSGGIYYYPIEAPFTETQMILSGPPGTNGDDFGPIKYYSPGNYFYFTNTDTGDTYVSDDPFGNTSSGGFQGEQPQVFEIDEINGKIYFVNPAASTDIYRGNLDFGTPELLLSIGSSIIDMEFYPRIGLYYTTSTGLYLYNIEDETNTLLISASNIGGVGVEVDYSSPIFTSLTPSDNNTSVTIGTSQLQMIFDEEIKKSITAGTETNIEIYRNGVLYEQIIRTSSNIIVSGQTATINLATPLVPGNYHVLVGNKVFRNVSNLDFIGVNLSTGWNFTVPCVYPSTTVSGLSATMASSSSIDVAWTRGSGDEVIILAREATSVDADPVDGTSYISNAAFGTGDEVGTGNFVVYKGTASAVTVTGLSTDKQYYFKAYELATTGPCYLTPGIEANAIIPPEIISLTTVDNSACSGFNGEYTVADMSVGVATDYTYDVTSLGGFVLNDYPDPFYFGLEDDNYTITATSNSTGFTSAPYEFTILLNPIPPTIDGIVVDNTMCSPGNGSISINIDGGMPEADYTISWYEGTTPSGPVIGSTATITDLLSGDYTVEVMNNNTFCYNVATYTVADATTSFTATLSGDASICEGSSSLLTVNTAPDTGPYDVVLNDGVADFSVLSYNNADPIAVTPTSTTSYTLVSVTNSSGCTASVSGSATVTVTSQITINPTITANTNCLTPYNGAINLAISGGSGALVYSWSGPSSFTSSSQNITDLEPGSYTVNITDSGSPCTSSTTVTVADNSTQPVITVDNVTDHTSCSVPSGAVAITVTGLSPGTETYSWTGPNGFTASTEDISGLEAGSYTLVAEQSGNPSCTATTTVTVADLSNPVTSASISGSYSVCEGDTENLFISISGGTAPYTVELSTGGSTFTTTNYNVGTGIAVTPSTTTTYELASVTDAAGCVAQTMTGSATVEVTPAITLTSVITNNTKCLSPYNGAITLNVTGGSGSLDYSWSGPSTFSASTKDISDLEPGSYTVTITDLTSPCTASTTVVVADNSSQPVITVDGITDNSSCGAPNGAVNATVTGLASGLETYSWSGPNGFTATTEDIANLEPGSYTLIAEESGNPSCTATTTVTVGDITNPVSSASISGGAAICEGSSANLTITIVGGTAPYEVVISDGSSTFSTAGVISGSTITVNPASTTTYTLSSVTDMAGCSAGALSGSATVTVTPAITVTPTVTHNTSCTSPYNGAVTLDITGGSGSFSYSWTGTNAFTSTTKDISDLGPGNFSVSITDNGSSCVASADVVVEDMASALVISVDQVVHNTSCSSPFNGIIQTTITGGSGTYSYSWSGPAGFSATTKDLNDLAPGAYTLTATDINATTCSSSVAVEVLESATPPAGASLSGTTEICISESATLTLNTSGGVLPFTVEIQNIGTITYGGTPITVTPSATTSYTLISLTDANNCTPASIDNTPVTITVHNEPTSASVAVSDVEVCADAYTDLGGNTPTSGEGQWRLVSGSGLITNSSDPNSGVTGLGVGLNVFEWTIFNGSCPSSSALVNISRQVTPRGTGDIVSQSGLTTFCQNEQQVTFTAIGIVDATSFIWSLPEGFIPVSGEAETTEPSITVNLDNAQSGIIEVIGKNICGSSPVSNALEVTVSPAPEATIIVADQITSNRNTTFSFQGSTDITEVLWSFGDGETSSEQNPVHLYSTPGNYTVSLELLNETGCTNIIEQAITVMGLAPIAIENIKNAITPNGDGANDHLVIVNIENYPTNTVTLLDRWGVEIIKLQNYENDWDLTVAGKVIPAGNYLCIVQIKEGDTSESKVVTRTVTVVK